MTGPLKLLHLTLNMDIGGTEQVIKQLVTGLDSERFENSVACIDGRVGSMGQELAATGTPTLAWSRQAGLDWSLISSIRAHLKEHKIDVLHCHQYTPFTYGAIASCFTSTKVVFTEHGRFHPDRFTWKRRLINQLLRHSADAIVAISSATRDALAHYEWVPRNAIVVIYNGLTAPQLNGPDKTLRAEVGFTESHRILGTVSRLDTIKNQPMMIEAFEIVLSRHSDARLLIVGDGAERDTLEAMVHDRGLTDSVFFTGFKSNPEPYLDLMDVFLLSSHSEGTSMTLLEAMAKEKSCVVTNVGGNPEIIEDGVNGYLTTPGSAESFANAIDVVLSKPDAQSSVGNAARRTFLDRFELTSMIRRYEALYQKVSS